MSSSYNMFSRAGIETGELYQVTLVVMREGVKEDWNMNYTSDVIISTYGKDVPLKESMAIIIAGQVIQHGCFTEEELLPYL